MFDAWVKLAISMSKTTARALKYHTRKTKGYDLRFAPVKSNLA